MKTFLTAVSLAAFASLGMTAHAQSTFVETSFQEPHHRHHRIAEAARDLAERARSLAEHTRHRYPNLHRQAEELAEGAWRLHEAARDGADVYTDHELFRHVHRHVEIIRDTWGQYFNQDPRLAEIWRETEEHFHRLRRAIEER